MKIFALILMISTSFLSLQAQDTMAHPQTKITDLTNLLTKDQIASLNTIATNFQNNVKGNAYVLIIDSLPDAQNIMNYSKGIFKKWGLNTEGAQLNFLIVYSRKEHALRIEGSDRVIALVTKEYLQQVTTKSMLPYFQKRQDFEGLKRGMEMVILKIENNN